jgi:hypothetical protein
MKQELEKDSRIRYTQIEGAKLFNSWIKIVPYLKEVYGAKEIMFLLKDKSIGIAKRGPDTDVHPRIFGGMPDVDMAGTVVANLGDIPVGNKNINQMTEKEKRKALMGWQGEITFTNESGHFKFDSLPEDVKKTLTEIVKGGRELTEDVQVKFRAH